MSVKKFEAVIFDLDGTLLNTVEDIAGSVNEVLVQNGFPAHAIAAYHRFIGDGMRELVCRALPCGDYGAGEIDYYTEAVREEYRRRWADHTAPYPGVTHMLDNLEKRRVPKAILSNKPHEFTVLTVERLLPLWRFDTVQGDRPEVPRKPDPAGALAIAHQWGINPASIIYMGDSGTDMRTAAAAGMYPVGALWGYRDSAELAGAGAARLIKAPYELESLFNG